MSSDRFKYINLEAIHDIADGDEEFIGEIIGNYLSTVSDSIRSLEQAIADDHAEQVVFSAHKLKGSFAFVGAGRLEDLAIKVEANPTAREALGSQLSEIKILAEEVAAELQTVLQGLNL